MSYVVQFQIRNAIGNLVSEGFVTIHGDNVKRTWTSFEDDMDPIIVSNEVSDKTTVSVLWQTILICPELHAL